MEKRFEGEMYLNKEELEKLLQCLLPCNDQSSYGDEDYKWEITEGKYNFSPGTVLVQTWGVEIPRDGATTWADPLRRSVWCEWHPDAMPDHDERELHPSTFLSVLAAKKGLI